MTENVKAMLELIRSGEYKNQRINNENFDLTEKVKGHSQKEVHAILLESMLDIETPYIIEGDIFGFNRRNINCPFFINERGKRVESFGGNNTPNYRSVIERGFDDIIRELEERKANAEGDKALFYEYVRRQAVAALNIADRYAAAAKEQGNTRLAEALMRVPHKSARSYYEALVFFKFIVYTMRCGGYVHLTLGRFDQYMLSYFNDDLARGVSRDELLELTELFFLALNIDADIYFGLQQGDNGQSIVLGGYDKNGNDMFNDLSSVCMDASLELKVIDPKVNLRVSKKTPDSMYEYGTKLTKQGLGFPQYCNDDIAIPYLISMGYDEDDAYNYTVAACWEYIVPNCGMDIPNICSFDFPMVVNKAVHNRLISADTFEDFMVGVEEEVKIECQRLMDRYNETLHPEKITDYCQYQSIFFDGCIEKGIDISSHGTKYNNFGAHGLGIANGADAIAAVKKLVFEENTVGKEELIAALDADFEGKEELRKALADCPKMGNNDDYVDNLASELMEYFVSNLSGKPNGCGGVWRAGTGSAMGYVTHARECGATADGRHAGDYYSSSFSPAITTTLNGPLSVIQSFTKYDLKKISNGGPLTMELHDTVFRNEEGEKKVAQLVKAFIHLGGHQLQLNAINRDRLLEAQKHPEEHKNLIVRVWGWSGYFCELSIDCQNHIIKRTEFTF